MQIKHQHLGNRSRLTKKPLGKPGTASFSSVPGYSLFLIAAGDSIFPSPKHTGLNSGTVEENLEKLPVRSSSQNVFSELDSFKVPTKSKLLDLNPSEIRTNPLSIP